MKKQPSLYNFLAISSSTPTISIFPGNSSIFFKPNNAGHSNGVYKVFTGILNIVPLYSNGVVIIAYYIMLFFYNSETYSLGNFPVYPFIIFVYLERW